MKRKVTYNIMQDAADHWPEDEAAELYDFRYVGREEIDLDRIKRDIADMETIFRREPDGDALVARFHAELTRLKEAES